MNKTFSLIILVLIIIGAGWYYYGQTTKSAPATGEPIKVGFIAALTGVGTSIGEEELKGAKLAVEEINNNGGVNGRPLKLIPEDISVDKLKVAGTVANKLINIDQVVAIVGPQWDEPAIAILPIIEKAKVPMIGPDTTDTIEVDGLGSYLFSTWYDNRVGITELLKFAQAKDIKKVVTIRPLDAGFWKFAADEFRNRASKYGVEIVEDMDIGNPLQTDYRTFITKAKQFNPDALFFVTADPAECIFLKQMRELSLDVPLLATEAAGNYVSLENCAADMERLYFSTPVHFSGYNNFADSFKKKFGEEPKFPSAVTSYDAVRVLAEALKKTNGEGGEALRDVLAETKNFSGASLPDITFNEKGFVITPPDAFEMQTVKDGEFVKVAE